MPLKGYSGKTQSPNCEISVLSYLPESKASRANLNIFIQKMGNVKQQQVTLSQIDSQNSKDARGQVFEAIDNQDKQSRKRYLLTIENLSPMSTRLVFGIEDVLRKKIELCHIEQ